MFNDIVLFKGYDILFQKINMIDEHHVVIWKNMQNVRIKVLVMIQLCSR